jgi:hypothetical protein
MKQCLTPIPGEYGVRHCLESRSAWPLFGKSPTRFEEMPDPSGTGTARRPSPGLAELSR